MNKLIDLTKDFDVSRPVFRLQLDDSGRTINVNTSEPVYKYEPKSVEDDHLSELVCSNYNERFDTKESCFTIDKNEIANRSMEDIRNSIGKFIERNLEMRNPRQSKLYRWAYRNMPNTSEVNDTLVMVYKYLRSFTNDDMRMTIGSMDHMKNGLALLEAIMEKYEQ